MTKTGGNKIKPREKKERKKGRVRRVEEGTKGVKKCKKERDKACYFRFRKLSKKVKTTRKKISIKENIGRDRKLMRSKKKGKRRQSKEK